MENYSDQRIQICEIGRRIYEKGFVAANEGNLSTRVADNLVLITPTLYSKGFLKPDELCLIDLNGRVLSQNSRPSSEHRLHLTIYRTRMDVSSVVHCHPPHATAFAIAGEPIPTGVLPEPDIFLGKVPTAPYVTPGNQQFADSVLPFVNSTNTIILANHGTVSYDADLERALWLTEILDAYCRTLILARQLGPVTRLPDHQIRELVELRKDWGFGDPAP